MSAETSNGSCISIVPYKNSWEHLFDELTRLEYIIRLELLKSCDQTGSGNILSQLKGLILTDRDINIILNNNREYDIDKYEQLYVALKQLEERIFKRRAASIEEGVYLSLPHLSKLFNLTPFEESCIIICLSIELDTKYEKLYAHLQGDVMSKKPTPDTVLRLLCGSSEEKLAARSFFMPESPLFKYILTFTDTDCLNTLISKPIKLDERIVNFTLGYNRLDYRLEGVSDIAYPSDFMHGKVLIEDRHRQTVNLIKKYLDSARNISFYFYGPEGSGKRHCVKAVCSELGCPVVFIDLLHVTGMAFEEVVRVAEREAVLQNSAVCFMNFDVRTGPEKHLLDTGHLLNKLKSTARVTFILGQTVLREVSYDEGTVYVTECFSIPDVNKRKAYWEKFSQIYEFDHEMDFSSLAGKFRFTPGQIKNALAAANGCVGLHRRDGKINSDHLYAACRTQARHRLDHLAQKIETRYGWDDIILPDDQKNQLNEVCSWVKNRQTVYGEWGFDRKHLRGSGLTVLFSGPSGTGKTMAAEIIAKELKLELYKIDLSQVVSKYIGETEKNLQQIFNEAQTSNVVLFFDEADALFGKRSEVKDSHDRYANIEISYLLQKMEDHTGITILATNLYNNMDDAFARRMHFSIEFPFPDEEIRRKIWKVVFPDSTPLSKDINFDMLSDRIRLTGGNIKSIAVASAFIAAQSGSKVKMEHIMQAARREYQKLRWSWEEVGV